MISEFNVIVGDRLMSCSGSVNQGHFNTAKLFWNAALEKAAKLAEIKASTGPGAQCDKHIKALEVEIRALKEE